MIFDQMLLDIHGELAVDLFAGGGGASCGIEMALGRSVDVANNHDPDAVGMHRLNHPQTRHLTADVFEVCPREVTGGRPVGLLWASPDCTYHSKARGGKPIRHANKKRRALAWVIKRWAGQVRPRVIFAENVEEFVGWGPLRAKRDVQQDAKGRRVGGTGRVVRHDKSVACAGERTPVEEQALVPCDRNRGRTFRQFVRALEGFGYDVQWRELRACDYGAPTIRKRWFLIARCDGKPIVWPEPSHGAPDSREVRARTRKPWRTAAECIDWSIPMCSIFATKEEAKLWAAANGQETPKRPLAEATMRRLARGVIRYVVQNPKPFIVDLAHGERSRSGGQRWSAGVRSLDEPAGAVLASGNPAVAAPVIVPNMTNNAAQPADGLVPTVTGGNRNILAAGLLTHMTHDGERRAHPLEEAVPAVTGAQRGELALVAPLLTEHANASSQRTFPADEPTRTQCASVKGGHFSVVAPYLVPRYGERDGQEPRARAVDEPHPVIVPTANGASLAAGLLTTYHGEKREGDTRGSGLAEPADTIDTANRHGVVGAFLAKHFEGAVGSGLDAPKGTVTTIDHDSLVAASLTHLRGTATGGDAERPVGAQTAGGTHHGVVCAHLASHYSQDGGAGRAREAEQPAPVVTGTPRHALVYALLQQYYGSQGDPDVGEPLHTVTTRDRFGVVTVTVGGVLMAIADIAMRMLWPRELYRAQGFPDSYVIDEAVDEHGRRYRLTKTEQVRMCGNSVPPPVAAALVGANVPEMIVRTWEPEVTPSPRRRRRAAALA